jgi:hypothetical protein
MELKKGQTIKCIKSWELANADKTKKVVDGQNYIVQDSTPTRFAVGVPVESTIWGPFGISYAVIQFEDLWFMNHEFDTYFIDPFQKKKCDCGFIIGTSAAHYRWCSSQELVA